jgi:serine/threonine protein kinase
MADASLFDNHVVSGRFQIDGVLDEGFFSNVFAARDVTTGKPVAVKILKFSRKGFGNAEVEFQNESALLQRLSGSTNVVALISPYDDATVDVFPAGSSTPVSLPYVYFVLELMEGRSLAELLPVRGELSWVARLDIFRDVVKGVQQMHRQHIYHRDLKASNVLLRPDRATFIAKVSDLGRSRDVRDPQVAPDAEYLFGRGDINHRPPECQLGAGGTSEHDFYRGDLYLLGSVLYELASGSPLTVTAFTRPLVRLAPPEGSLDPVRVYEWNIPQVRALYNDVFEEFDEELPPSIRRRCGRLLRQLCDADPTRRAHRTKRDRVERNLDWLLNEIDILTRIITNSTPSAAKVVA